MTWASPNERTPGVSITQPACVRAARSAIAEDDVCRPLPIALTTPVARSADGHQRVDQRRLADAGVPDEHRRSARPAAPAARPAGRRAGSRSPAPTARRSARARRPAGARSDFVRHSSGSRPAVSAATRQRSISPYDGSGSASDGDDDQLVGVGDDHPLVRVVVVGGAPQHGRCARRCGRCGPARPASPDRSPTTPTRSPTAIALAAEFARPHRGDLDVVDEHRVAAAVDGEHHAVGGVLVRRALLRARPGAAAARADADVVLVEASRCRARPRTSGADQGGPHAREVGQRLAWCSRCRRPRRRRRASPSTAPAVAIRWSA